MVSVHCTNCSAPYFCSCLLFHLCTICTVYNKSSSPPSFSTRSYDLFVCAVQLSSCPFSVPVFCSFCVLRTIVFCFICLSLSSVPFVYFVQLSSASCVFCFFVHCTIVACSICLLFVLCIQHNCPCFYVQYSISVFFYLAKSDSYCLHLSSRSLPFHLSALYFVSYALSVYCSICLYLQSASPVICVNWQVQF